MGIVEYDNNNFILCATGRIYRPCTYIQEGMVTDKYDIYTLNEAIKDVYENFDQKPDNILIAAITDFWESV